MIAETTAALGGLKTAYDIAKSLQALQTSTEVKQATADMLDALISARQLAMEQAEAEAGLQKKIHELEAELASSRAWQVEAQNYEPKRFFAGGLAYVLRPNEVVAGEQFEFCTTCFEEGRKSLLHHEYRTPGMDEFAVCHRCGSEALVQGERRAAHGRAPTPSHGR